MQMVAGECRILTRMKMGEFHCPRQYTWWPCSDIIIMGYKYTTYREPLGTGKEVTGC